MEKNTVVRLSRICKSFGSENVLNNIDLEIKDDQAG